MYIFSARWLHFCLFFNAKCARLSYAIYIPCVTAAQNRMCKVERPLHIHTCAIQKWRRNQNENTKKTTTTTASESHNNAKTKTILNIQTMKKKSQQAGLRHRLKPILLWFHQKHVISDGTNQLWVLISNARTFISHVATNEIALKNFVFVLCLRWLVGSFAMTNVTKDLVHFSSETEIIMWNCIIYHWTSSWLQSFSH